MTGEGTEQRVTDAMKKTARREGEKKRNMYAFLVTKAKAGKRLMIKSGAGWLRSQQSAGTR